MGNPESKAKSLRLNERLDQIWLEVDLDKVWSPEFIKKGFWIRGLDTRQRSLQNLLKDYQDDDDSSDVLAIAALAEADAYKAAQLSLNKLSNSLLRKTLLYDSFSLVLEQQLHILSCIQNVTVRYAKRDRPSLSKYEVQPSDRSLSATLSQNEHSLWLAAMVVEVVGGCLLSQELNSGLDKVAASHIASTVEDLEPGSLKTTRDLRQNEEDTVSRSLESLAWRLAILPASSTTSNSDKEDEVDRSIIARCLLSLGLARLTFFELLLCVAFLVEAPLTQPYGDALTATTSVASKKHFLDLDKTLESQKQTSSSSPSKAQLVLGQMTVKRRGDSAEKVDVKDSSKKAFELAQSPEEESRNSETVSLIKPQNEAKLVCESDGAGKLKLCAWNVRLDSSKLAFLSTLEASRPSFETQDASAPEVWAFGQNSYGELGLADTNNRKLPVKVDILDKKDIVMLAAGNEHTLAVSGTGTVYTMGYNDNGQCGHGNFAKVCQLAPVEALEDVKITKAYACNGCEHSMFVSDEGKLYTCGYNYRGQLGLGTTTNENIPRLVRGLESKRITLVSCSYYHTAALTDKGELYTFGRNDFGQLGHGDTLDKKVPQRVEALSRYTITSMACGQYHTAVLSNEGFVFTSGKNDYGQLGTDSQDGQVKPSIVRGALDGEIAIQVACGYYHTLVLASRADTRRVFGFGRNDYGQLGLGHMLQRVFEPEVVRYLDGKDVESITAGCYHSVASGSMGAMYVFGRNNHGQLGTGDTEERAVPCLLDGFIGRTIEHVAAGFYHTVFLIRDVAIGGFDSRGLEEPKQKKHNARSAKVDEYYSHDESMWTIRGLNEPDVHDPIGNDNDSFPAWKAAGFILFHLSRLSEPSRAIYSDSISQARVRSNGNSSGHKPFCSNFSVSDALSNSIAVDSRPQVLACLQSVLDQVLRITFPVEDLKFSALTSGIRILHANVSQLLRLQSQDVGARLPLGGEQRLRQDLDSGAYLQTLTEEISVSLSDSQSLPNIFSAYRLQLLRVLSQCKGDSPIESYLREETIRCFCLGFELFFHSSRSKREFLGHLLHCYPDDHPQTGSLSQEKQLYNDLSNSAKLSLTSSLLHRYASPGLAWEVTGEAMNVSPESVKGSSVQPIQDTSLETVMIRLLSLCTAAPAPDDYTNECVGFSQNPVSACSKRLNDNASLHSTTTSEKSSLSSTTFKPHQRAAVSLLKALIRNLGSRAGQDIGVQNEDGGTMYNRLDTARQNIAQNGEIKSSPYKTALSLIDQLAAESKACKALQIPSSWQPLIQISIATFRTAIDEVSALIDLRQTEGAAERHINGVKDVNSLEKEPTLMKDGITTQILPAVLLVLLPIAHRSVFAEILSEELHLLLLALDRLNISSLTSGNTSASSQSSMLHDTDAAEILLSDAVDEVFSLAPSLYLQKICIELSCRFASALVSGGILEAGGEETTVTIDVRKYSLWPQTSLFRGGFDENIKSMLWAKRENMLKSLAVNTTPSSACCMSEPAASNPNAELKSRWPVWDYKHEGQSCLAFVEDVIDGQGNGLKFANFIRKSYELLDPPYRMLAQQGKRSPDGSLIERAERSLFACILTHTGMADEACLHAKFLGQSTEKLPPKRFVVLWKQVAELRQLLLRCRARVRSDLCTEKDTSNAIDSMDFRQICEEVSSRSALLLGFTPESVMSIPSPHDPVCVFASTTYLRPTEASEGPYQIQPELQMGARYGNCEPFLAAYPRTKWRSLRIAFHIACRWKLIYQESKKLKVLSLQALSAYVEPVARQILRFLETTPSTFGSTQECLANANSTLATIKTQSALEKSFSGIHSLPPKEAVDASILLSLQIDRQYRDKIRARGYAAFQKLLSATSVNICRRQVLRNWTKCARNLEKTTTPCDNSENNSQPLNSLCKLYRAIHGDLEALQSILLLDTEKWRADCETGKDRTSLGRQADNALSLMFSLHDALLCWTIEVPVGMADGADGKVFSLMHSIGKAIERFSQTLAQTVAQDPVIADGVYNSLPATVMTLLNVTRNLADLVKDITRWLAVHAAILLRSTTLSVQPSCQKDEGLIPIWPRMTGMFRSLCEQLADSISSLSALKAESSTRSQAKALKTKLGGSVKQVIDCPMKTTTDWQLEVPLEELMIDESNTLAELSVSSWVLLYQDGSGTGKKMVFCLGRGQVWCAVIAVNEVDRTLIVNFSSTSGVVETVQTRTSIPIRRWCHVVISIGFSSLQIYIDSVLDVRRSISIGQNFSDMSLVFGKPPDTVNIFDGISRPFEGLLGGVICFPGEISEDTIISIHQGGAPTTPESGDRDCFRLVVALLHLSRTPEGLSALLSPMWMQALFSAFFAGTSRIQQIIFRIFCILLRHTTPSIVDRAICSRYSRGEVKWSYSFVRYMLRLSGLGQFRLNYTQNDLRQAVSTSYVMQTVNLVERRLVKTKSNTICPEAASEDGPQIPLFPAIFVCDAKTEEEGQDEDLVQLRGERLSIAIECAALLRNLSQVSSWRKTIVYYLEDGLKHCAERITQYDVALSSRSHSFTLPLAESLGSLCVLGGDIEMLRPGAKVHHTKDDKMYLVVGVPAAADYAQIVLANTVTDPENILPASLSYHFQNIKTPGSHQATAKAIHASVADLVVVDRGSSAFSLFAKDINVEPLCYLLAQAWKRLDLTQTKCSESLSLQKEVDSTILKIGYAMSLCAPSWTTRPGDTCIQALLKSMLWVATSPLNAQEFQTMSEIQNKIITLRLRYCHPTKPADLDEHFAYDQPDDPASQLFNVEENYQRAGKERQELAMAVADDELENSRYLTSIKSRENEAKNNDLENSDDIKENTLEDDYDDDENINNSAIKHSDATALIQQLRGLGVPEQWCEVALRETHNDVEAASNWIVDSIDVLTKMLGNTTDESLAEIPQSIGRATTGKQTRFSVGYFHNEENDHKLTNAGACAPAIPIPLAAVSAEPLVRLSPDAGIIDSLIEPLKQVTSCQENLVWKFSISVQESPAIENCFDDNKLSHSVSPEENVSHDRLGIWPLSARKEYAALLGRNKRNDLLRESANLERSFGILFARLGVLHLLNQIMALSERNLLLDAIDTSLLLKYARLMIFRGNQFKVMSAASSAYKVEELAIKSLEETMLLILKDRAESPACTILFNGCLIDLRNCTRSQKPDSRPVLPCNDEDALEVSRESFISWLFELLLAGNCFHIFEPSTIEAVIECLGTASVQLRTLIFRWLSEILLHWSKDMSSNKNCFVNTELVTVVGGAITENDVTELGLKEVCRELSPFRLFHSNYVQAMTTYLLELRALQVKWEKQLKVALPAEAGTRETYSGQYCQQCVNISSHVNSISNLAVRFESPTSQTKVTVCWDGSTFDSLTYECQVRPHIEPSQVTQEHITCPRMVYVGASKFASFQRPSGADLLFCSVRAFSTCQLCKNQYRGNWKDATLRLPVNEYSAFRFEQSNNEQLQVSHSGLVATYLDNDVWFTFTLPVSFVDGTHSWDVEIQESSSPYILFGVAKNGVSSTTFLGGDDFGWGVIADGSAYHARNKGRLMEEKFTSADVIRIILDLGRGTLSAAKNGKDMGVLFEGLTGVFSPAFSFYTKSQTLRLLPSSVPSVPSSISWPIFHDQTSGVALLTSVMEAMVSGSQDFPDAFLIECYRNYVRWMKGQLVRCPTRNGFDLFFDLSPPDSPQFGFLPRDRVLTPQGEGIIVGQAMGKQWIWHDGDSGAWILQADSLQQNGQQCRVVKSLAEEECHVEFPSIKGPEPFIVTFQQFADSLRSCVWSLQLDASIVHAINDYCDRKGKTPWNLMPTLLLKEVVPFMAHSISPLNDRILPVSEDIVLARYALLRMMNHYVASLLHHFNMSSILNAKLYESSSPANLLQCYTLKPPRHILLLSSLRSCVFLHVKLHALNRSIEITNPPVSIPEDEYEYPEEIPQLVLNRPRAAAAKDHPDPAVRLQESLFGQACKMLHYLDAQTLRITFSHPMDDSQIRAFRVRFEGEGVDDYGGPYRECFSQFAAEIQDIRHLGEASTAECILPLLMPSPNWRNKLGDHQDKLIISPKTSEDSKDSRMYKDMYRFLGRILGIAVRTQVAVRFDFPALMWKFCVGQEAEPQDLDEIDQAVKSMAMQLQELLAKSLVGDEVATSSLDSLLQELRWTTTLSDGSTIDLCPNGTTTPVDLATCRDYVAAVYNARLHESDTALKELRTGLTSVIPSSVLPLFSWRELEMRVCGKPGVDLDLLKANTEYDDGLTTDHTVVRMFWSVLASLDDLDRSAFLRFAWARSRLPSTAESFHQKFKLQIAGEEVFKTANIDSALPQAHTCFFSLTLPKYSTEEVMRKQLLYAVHNCIEMDADFRMADGEMRGWTPRDI